MAIMLAASLAAQLRAVHVLVDGEIERALGALHSGDVRTRRDLGATAVLDHVARRAAQAGVIAETVSLGGEPARCILDEARSWTAALIVMGRSDLPAGTGQPYVGGEVRQVLEFAEEPVLVVPVGSDD
jgi:nucleotide-binding universal stress UspA family protein